MDDTVLIDGLKAFAHPVRLTILRALAGGEANVGQIEEATNLGQPGLSQQLSVLRNAGLVQSRRQSKLVFYSLDAPQIGKLAEAIGALQSSDSGSNRAVEGSVGVHHSRRGAAVFATVAKRPGAPPDISTRRQRP